MSQSLNIPSAAISRLVTYLRILEKLESQGINRTSSNDLAERAQVSAFQVRKDLAYFGRFGTRGMGYTVAVLKRELRRILGLTRPWNVVIMGMGRLGQAIAHYPGASDYEFSFVGLFDPDPNKVGLQIRNMEVMHPDHLRDFVRSHQVDMGFIAVPADRAQDVAQTLVEAGIKGILNFAPVVIQPKMIERPGLEPEKEEEWEGVIVENIDFLAGMKRLAFYILNPGLRELEEVG
ncbi:redox-sensing transcriptional repressor Rex [Deinococcus roseus]|uniref:Redox-sensing transcriptional repressor Rex n=1 Tax=Deinococcus roseus TaxID=392414 RepID=A0ABQ2CXC3_9DEIO|nr:redox-sensing transcriptional repressor Rex [Deinococcus roseus]GGJ30468.1 redox-sensing transcriptional repressor Rex [Deinococcus roseus]